MNPVRDGDHAVDAGPDDSFHGRFSHLISTQCQRSVRILGESTESRPISLKDFKETLEKSVHALNVSYLHFYWLRCYFHHDFHSQFLAPTHHEEIE